MNESNKQAPSEVALWVKSHEEIILWMKAHEELSRWLKAADTLVDFGSLRINYHNGKIASYRMSHGGMEVQTGSTVVINGTDITIFANKPIDNSR